MGAAAGIDPGVWPRPVPTIGDPTSAVERAGDPAGWAFPAEDRDVLHAIIDARRDVRRFRPDPVPRDLVDRVLGAAHAAPSVGHSQPWRFVVVTEPSTRARAAWMADRARLAQAAAMAASDARHLLDLQLDGIREAPIGIVVACDRRADPAGVLGRATFHDADMWSCACAIQNLWLAARAHGLGVGWVTLFEPDDLARLVGLPAGVSTLGWLCLGYPDERQPEPGLQRAGWSQRVPLADVVLRERWPAESAPAPPRSRVEAPAPRDVVGARDATDVLLTTPGSLGILDVALDRIVACCGPAVRHATLVIAAGDHPVADLGVTPYQRSVTADVVDAARAGSSIGAATAGAAGLSVVVVDAGSSEGDLLHRDALDRQRVEALVARGSTDGRRLAADGLIALGEVGIGNTTVAAAVTAALTGAVADAVVGLGSGADTAMLVRKRAVVDGALRRWHARKVDIEPDEREHVIALVAALGGPEVAYLLGVVLGAAEAGGVIVLDGLLTSVAALAACRIDPAVAMHLIAGQRSREIAHAPVLDALGLQPLLDLRLRAGEGVGAALASRMLLDGLEVRRTAARVRARSDATL